MDDKRRSGTASNKPITVVGNICVDLIADVPERFLADHNLTPSICTHLPDRAAEESLRRAVPYAVYPGGSGGNIAAAMALLGLDVTFIGGWGMDTDSDLFWDSLQEVGVTCLGAPHPDRLAQSVFTFITPDRERHFACYYDPATILDAKALELAGFKASYILTDGYSLVFPHLRSQVDQFRVRHEMDRKHVFCVNDVSTIETAPDSVQNHFRFSDIMIMNGTEYDALARLLDTDNLLNYMMKSGKSGAITKGASGADLFTPERVYPLPTLTQSEAIVNMNGAGDAFTAGYMYGLVHDLTPEQTGHAAALCAKAVLQSESPRLGREAADAILEEMRQFF